MSITASQEEAQALDLREAEVTLIESADGPVAGDGTVLLHIIRPGLGRGRGRHLYEADMLKENAHKFSGWRMYLNHLSPQAKKAMAGLPRDVQDLGGRITEAWWDPNVPSTDRFGQGAVVGKAKPTPYVRDLIANDPEIVEASISATATGVRQGEHGGEKCWIVEGIEDKGSVDWVTEAGAGGRVATIMEAAIKEDQEGKLALLASLTDEEFLEHIAERPAVREQLTEAEEADEREQAIQEHTDKGLTREQAIALLDGTAHRTQESQEDDMPITAESLREALQDDDARSAILEALGVEDIIEARVASKFEEDLPDLVEAQVAAERDFIRATARADADRRVQVERMKADAHAMVETTKLPDGLKAQIKHRFTIQESGDPTPELDVVDDIGDDGDVSKRAEDIVKESVEKAIKEAQEIVGQINPARVRGQGATGAEDSEEQQKQAATGIRPGGLAESLLQEAGFDDLDKVYGDNPTALAG